MITEDKNTEERILDAAKKIFYLKGLDGARMQEIAEEAGINKSLLNYYFRSKEKLYQKILGDALGKFSIEINNFINTDLEIEAKINNFVNKYIDMLIENPFLPVFIINELNNNPDNLPKLFNVKNIIKNSTLLEQYNQEVIRGNFKPHNFLHFILNILSLSVFPFIVRPVIKHTFDLTDEQYMNIIQQRREIIMDVIYKWLKNS